MTIAMNVLGHIIHVMAVSAAVGKPLSKHVGLLLGHLQIHVNFQNWIQGEFGAFAKKCCQQICLEIGAVANA